MDQTSQDQDAYPMNQCLVHCGPGRSPDADISSNHAESAISSATRTHPPPTLVALPTQPVTSEGSVKEPQSDHVAEETEQSLLSNPRGEGSPIPDNRPAPEVPNEELPVAHNNQCHESAGQNSLQSPKASSNKDAEGLRHDPDSKSVWKIWALEIGCILLSLVLFIALSVLLFLFHDRPLSDWPFKISLNSFVAFSTTVIKAAFLLPITAAMGHTQWTWFDHRDPRPLYDLHVIDQASRGAWGSLLLLWRFRLRHFVALGALLMLISGLTSPVTQLAVNYHGIQVPITTEVAKTRGVWDLRLKKPFTDDLNNRGRKAMWMATLSDNSSFTQPLSYAAAAAATGERPFICSTGNCKFQPYQSLGVCMKLANISSELLVEQVNNLESVEDILRAPPNFRPDKNVTKVSLVSHTGTAKPITALAIAHQRNMFLITEMLAENLTFAYAAKPKLLRTKIGSFVSIYTTPTVYSVTTSEVKKDKTEPWNDNRPLHIHNFSYHAVEVLFHVCIKTYQTDINMGIENTAVFNTVSEPLGDGPFLAINCSSLTGKNRDSSSCGIKEGRWDETLDLQRYSVQNLTSERREPVDVEVFKVNYRSVEILAQLMRMEMFGACVSSTAGVEDPGEMKIGVSGAASIRELYTSVLFNYENILNPYRREVCLKNFFSNFATSLSAMIRVGVSENISFPVHGKPLNEVTYIKIQWGWLSFLAAEVLIAAVFLCLTLCDQVGSWKREKKAIEIRDIKDSVLAPLVALSMECQAAAGGELRSMDELKKAAMTLKVRLQTGKIVSDGDNVPPESGTL